MSAKDRLESLMLAKRSASDLSVMTPPNGGGVRVRMRLPKAEVERLMAESKDGAEVAEKIARLCMESGGAAANAGGNGDGGAIRRSVKSREVSFFCLFFLIIIILILYLLSSRHLQFFFIFLFLFFILTCLHFSWHV
ncbi:uncharacterized protein at1g66480 [Phtheirospermum japonicum]|uniref:Uncharacterized protein at1g66480 n=1 Tax=Phtheirospermum japonicum TaxID=374723 RepID=A0A830DE44_9LAMI|nr:uncharacterized protein at1g66480 [Phtheirospermum japonicum]